MPQLRGERSRGVTVCALLAGILLSSTPVARADVPAAWAWQAQRRAAPSLAAASGVPSGDLAVAWLGQPDKITYLGIKASEPNTLTGASLQLEVDEAAPNVDIEGAQVHACLVLLEWEYAEPMGWDAKPPTACDIPVPGRFDAPSTFTFALDPLAAALASPSVRGISIEPAETPASSFQVVFKPDIKLLLASGPSGGSQPAPIPVETAPKAESGPPIAAGQQYSPPTTDSATPPDDATPSSALTVSGGQRRDDGRPVSLTGVYVMLIVLAGLALGGRVLAQVLRSRRDEP